MPFSSNGVVMTKMMESNMKRQVQQRSDIDIIQRDQRIAL